MSFLERIFRKRIFWLLFFPLICALIASLYFELRSLGIPGGDSRSSSFNPIIWILYLIFWPIGWEGLFYHFSEVTYPKWFVSFTEILYFPLHYGSYLFYVGYLLFAFKARFMTRKNLFRIAWAIVIFTALSIHGCSNIIVNWRS